MFLLDLGHVVNFSINLLEIIVVMVGFKPYNDLSDNVILFSNYTFSSAAGVSPFFLEIY